MPTYVVTDPNTGKKVRLTGDTPPTDADLDEIFASIQTSAPKQAYSDVPDAAHQQFIDEAYAQKRAQAPQYSVGDKAKALGETALALGTGATGGLIGQMAGSVAGIGRSVLDGTFGTNEGANAAEQYAADVASSLTYKPSSPLAGDYLKAIGGVAEPFAGLAPMTGELGLIAQSARSAAPLARGMIPDGLPQSRASQEKAQRIVAGDQSRDLAKSMVPPESIARGKPRLSSDDLAKETIKQGFDEGLIQAIKASSTETKKKALKMVATAEQAKKNSVFGSYSRPADVAGDSLAQRLKTIKEINLKAGEEIDAAANKSLKGQPVDYDTPINRLRQDIESAGITIDEDGRLNFSGSDLEFSTGDKRLVSNIYSRALRTDGSDALKVHKLKRLIDRTVDYGKGSQSGITSGGESIAKSFRRAIDESLDSTFEDYNAANTKYAETIGALTDFQNAAGKTIDIFGENADKALGSTARGLLSNNKSRQRLMNSIKAMEDTALKYGTKFDDDIMTEILVADELDKMFGAAARTSLQGDVGKGVKRGLETATGQRSIQGMAIEGVASGVEKLRGINEENAFKSIKELLKREIE